MFDSSSDYANEHESGKGLKRAIDEGLVKREDVFIVTKLWNTFKVRLHRHDALHVDRRLIETPP